MRTALILFIISNLFTLRFAYSSDSTSNQAIIKSEIMQINKKKQTINFVKEVSVEKSGDTMFADKMRVVYNNEEIRNKKVDNPSKIKEIAAMGNVKIFSQEFVASGNYGYYNPERNIFKLEGNVIVNDGTSIASGKNFIYDLENKKGIFLGEKQKKSLEHKDDRVTVIISDETANSLNENSSKDTND